MKTLALLLILAAMPAAADVFDRTAGLWGLEDDPELSCEANPHEIRFSADRRRAEFLWQHPIVTYTGAPGLAGRYTVLGQGPDRITLALDGEERRTGDGAPVVWILRLQAEGQRYCWGRADWPEDLCIDHYIRCAPPAPLS